MIIARKLTKETNKFCATMEKSRKGVPRNHIRFLCEVVLSKPAKWYIVALYPGDQVYHHGKAYHIIYNLITKDADRNCFGFNITIGVKWALLEDSVQFARQATPAHQVKDGTLKKCSTATFAKQIGWVSFILFMSMFLHNSL
jgi:hypothetical protein